MTALYLGSGLSKRFGPTLALDHVDFELAPGEVKGLVGANGAGKSTLLKILAGALAPDAGELRLAGEGVRFQSMRDAAGRGIALVSQELNLFPALSIRENLAIVAGRLGIARETEAKAVLGELGLYAPLSTTVRQLSLGDRQIVEIARALLQHPRVLILDEPTSALHKPEKERLLGVVKQLRNRGVAIIYVSHFLEELLEVADELVVLRDGRRVATNFAPSKERLGEVISAMLGERADEASNLRHAAAQKPPRDDARHGGRMLNIQRLDGPMQLRVSSLVIPAGQVVGVAGLAGAGVEELFAMLFGRLRPRHAQVVLPDGAGLPKSPTEAVRRGIAYIPADRKRIGLLLQKSIAENVTSVRALVQGKDGFLLRRAQLEQLSADRCRQLGVKATSVRQPVGSLSGGNQQKVVFAKWLEAEPSVLLFDDPTRGVDIGAKREMHGVIRALADEGRIVLVYSSDPLELVNIADRVHVFVDGLLTSELSGPQLTEHNLVTAMNEGAGGAAAETSP